MSAWQTFRRWLSGSTSSNGPHAPSHREITRYMRDQAALRATKTPEQIRQDSERFWAGQRAQAWQEKVEEAQRRGVPVEVVEQEFQARYAARQREMALRQAVPNTPQYLGQMPYGEFLQTGYWKKVRKQVLFRDGHHCQKCKRWLQPQDLVVHHLTYANHGDEANHMEDLVTLCKSCHNGIHAAARAS